MTSSADVNREIPAGIPKLDSPEITYDIASYAHSLPRIVRVLPEGGDQNGTVGASGLEVRFKIPAGTYNFSKSVLKYLWNTKTTEALVTIALQDRVPIRQITLTTQEGGTVLSSLMYADQYTRIVSKAETSFNRYITNDSLDAFYPSNIEAKSNRVGPISELASVNYLEMKYADSFPAAANAAAEAKTAATPKAIELSTFKNTLFELDKMIYYPEPLTLTVWFSNRGDWCQLATANTDFKAGAAEAKHDIELTKMELFMKQESDPTIDAECKAAVLNAPADAPFTVYVPVVTGRQSTALNDVNASYQVQLGSSMGVRLSKVYATPVPSPHAPNTRYDSANADANGAPTKVLRYQTKFNAINVQPDAVDVTANGDWFLIRDKLKGTAILNNAVYKRNWLKTMLGPPLRT